ncbi:MAG: SNF2 helicase associated domain-containing protein [Lachnospiraceae bacterium]|nr:SNF2 helicase associated domain-containing protein [Lachnospiraceae bacterium]
MELRDYFRSFTDDELTRGAEQYYAGDITDIDIKEDAKLKAEECVEIVGKWTEWSYAADGSRNGEQNTSYVKLSMRASLPCVCDCCCKEFSANLYGCAHVAALLTAYMVKTEGDEVFKGSRLEELLRSVANVEDPFAPGVLRRTDDRLLSILKDAVDTALPQWDHERAVRKKSELYGVECALTVSEKERVLLDIKVGSGRKYLIKNIMDFLEAYRNERAFTIGKEEVELTSGIFDTFGRNLLDHLVEAAYSDDDSNGGTRIFRKGNPRNERYLIFYGRQLDELMEILDAHSVTLNEIRDMEVRLKRKGLYGILKKKAYGASLQMSPLESFAVTGAWIYLSDKEGLFRIGVSSVQQVKELKALIGIGDGMYIRESDIGRVLNRLSPFFREYGELICKGLDAENYEKENPGFEFRLDYADKILSCEPFAVYPIQDFRSHLFDNMTDRARRNGQCEAKAAEFLMELFDAMDEKSFTLYSKLNEEELFEFMKDNLPALEKLGSVYSTDAIKRRRVRFLPKIKASVKIEDGRLLLSVSSDDIAEDEMFEILHAYKRKKKYYRLKSGEFLALQDQEDKIWETVSELFENYGDRDPQKIKLPLYRALYLLESMEKRDDVVFESSGDYMELIRKMDPDSVKELPVPKSLSKIIRPYQLEGFRWIKLLKNCGFGGILADDMGLGKTLQVLSFLLSEKAEGKKGDELRTIVICPASLVYNWKREIETYTKELNVAMITGTAEERAELIRSSGDADIWVTSYDLLKRDILNYDNIRFANEVIDEAQYIKNQNTQASQSVRLVNSAFRLALTGTPIENHLGELWSIMDYLMPGFLYNYTGFQKTYEVPIVSMNDGMMRERLRCMVHPFILRRMKKQVLKELPDKMEETVYVSMDTDQKKLYSANVKKLKEELNAVSKTEFKKGKMQFLSQLTLLRELCCDPALLYEDYKGGSAKLETCMELVRQSIDGGHKLLLFSQFTSMLDIICERLNKEKIAYHRIDGSVSKENRMQMVDSFANDDVPVFCISLKAGGTGLNLTAADIVIHYDPWWNKAAQDQATDRTHRIGQTRTVNVYELIAQDTIEERIQKIKESKTKLAEDILSGGEISSATFDKDEMLKLLS